MRVISSQRYLNREIVEAKKREMRAKGLRELVLKVWDVGDGECGVLFDGHHSYHAAKELGIPIRIVMWEHPGRLFGEVLLAVSRVDSDWYDLETGEIIQMIQSGDSINGLTL